MPLHKIILPLIASMAFSISLLLTRIVYTESLLFLFLVWNLYLACIPLGISVLLTQKTSLQHKNVLFVSLFFLWLLFLPNAPYIITDFIHLRPRPEAPFWFDTLLLFSFAWNGLILGLLSLLQMHELLRRKLGATVAQIIVTLVFPLTAFGIFLGRDLRWNSWDALLNPLALAEDIFTHIFDSFAHFKAWGIMLLFCVFFLVSYGVVREVVRLVILPKERL